MTEHLEGHLLVAVPGVLEDPNFRRTVVLLLEHGGHGALGLVLNRPTDTRVDDPFPGWDDASSTPAVLFTGGPVQHGMIVALGRSLAPDRRDGFQPIDDEPETRLVTVDLRREPYELAPSLDALRVFAGYAGWGPGQLEREIDQGAWWVCDALPDDPFVRDPSSLWQAVLTRQGGTIALHARYPEDPERN